MTFEIPAKPSSFSLPSCCRRLLTRAAILLAVVAVVPRPARAEAPCTPGTTKRIAFLLKQQTAFRYLHADVP